MIIQFSNDVQQLYTGVSKCQGILWTGQMQVDCLLLCLVDCFCMKGVYKTFHPNLYEQKLYILITPLIDSSPLTQWQRKHITEQINKEKY